MGRMVRVAERGGGDGERELLHLSLTSGWLSASLRSWVAQSRASPVAVSPIVKSCLGRT